MKDTVKIALGIALGFGCIGAMCLGLGLLCMGVGAIGLLEEVAQGTEDELLPLGQSIIVENVEITVRKHEVTDSLASKYESETQPEEGAKFLWLYVSSKNVGEVKERLTSPNQFQLLYKGVEIGRRDWPIGILEARKQYERASVYSGYGREGWILYEVPLDADPAEITVRMTQAVEDFPLRIEYWFWRLE